MIRGRLLACALSLGCLGCDEPLEVLSFKQPQARDAGVPARPDAAADASATDAGHAFACERCRAIELCAADRCVDPTGATSLSAGLRHGCVVRGGQLSCWGDNGSGQLGSGDTSDRHAPRAVTPDRDWLAVAAAEQHTCALRAPGTLHCFGSNLVGQLGLGDRLTRDTPSQVPGLEGVVRVACGGDNCCASTADDTLHCWGANLEGSPGQADPPDSADVPEPRAVAARARFAQVSVGAAHTCAIRKDGALYCWGRNVEGQLGLSDVALQRREPTRVGEESDWREVAAGRHHTCGVRAEGLLFCWGTNEQGELGVGPGGLDDTKRYETPVQVDLGTSWQRVVVGWFHTCALRHTGELYCFGRSVEGQLGVGATIGSALPTPTLVSAGIRYARISAGSFHTCALDVAGRLSCWGANTEGQLGTGDTASRDEPALVL